MREIAGREPLVKDPAGARSTPQLRRTLRAHYRRKREHYGVERPSFYDRDLRTHFHRLTRGRRQHDRARFISRIRKDVRRHVAPLDGPSTSTTIDQVLEDMVVRSRELKLRAQGP